MSEYSDILEFLKQKQNEQKLYQLLEIKGYSNIQDKNFGLNQWTKRLIIEDDDNYSESNTQEKIPDHLVSFLFIPNNFNGDFLNINDENLHQWISEYKWMNFPGVKHPFVNGKIQACSEGLILPNLRGSTIKNGLEAFLLIRRDGICEYGIGRNAYYFNNEDTVFLFIQIIGRLWQFFLFVNDFQEAFLKDKSDVSRMIVNLRGTKDACLGNLAEGWKQPFSTPIFNSCCPRCLDEHLQTQKFFSPKITEDEISEVIRWFASRIDNAWGQFEPRCYVPKSHDENMPFAIRTRN